MRPYGVATSVNFCLPATADANDYEDSASFEAGDVTLTKDDGTPANITSLPTDEGVCYSAAFSATEMQTGRLHAWIVDQTNPKAWADWDIVVETYGAGGLHGALSWLAYCEDQGSRTCQEVASILLAEAVGQCSYTVGTSTWVCTDPEGNETRFTLVYGTDPGDRTDSTLAPMTP